VEDVVAREAGGRWRAAGGAAAAALLTLAGSIVASVTFADLPPVLLVDALRDAAGQPIPGRAGLRSAQVLFYDQHAATFIMIGVLLAAGALAVMLPLTYLYTAVRARRPETPRVGLVMAVAGPVALAVSELVFQIGVVIDAHDFATSADRSSAAARDVFDSGFVVAGQSLRQAGVIALAFAFILISLNAMRVGLLSRFMGILGIIVGVLFVVPLGSPLPIVQSFWLLALSALIAGRWPGGAPPAWAAGKAVPWPSQQDLRMLREKAAGGDASGPATPRRKEAPPPRPQPASKKKRRRRR
jgi:hypothetical protein